MLHSGFTIYKSLAFRDSNQTCIVCSARLHPCWSRMQSMVSLCVTPTTCWATLLPTEGIEKTPNNMVGPLLPGAQCSLKGASHTFTYNSS